MADVEILFDDCGEFEEVAWVPVEMARTQEAALCIIDEALDRSGYREYLVAEHMRMCVEGRGAWMRPDPNAPYPDESPWLHCKPDTPGAREFWTCCMVEQRFNLRRGLARIADKRRAPRLYRRHRENGTSRRQSLAYTWFVYFEPNWLAHLRYDGFWRRFGR